HERRHHIERGSGFWPRQPPRRPGQGTGVLPTSETREIAHPFGCSSFSQLRFSFPPRFVFNLSIRLPCAQNASKNKKATDQLFRRWALLVCLTGVLNEQSPGARRHKTTGATQKPASLPAVDQHTFILGSGDE